MSDTSCVDWEARLKASEPIIPAPIYPGAADKALAVFKALRIVDMAGRPTFGEVSAQWVFDFVRAVFGANDPDTGVQKITEYGLLVSKKNTKSTIGAGVMLTALILCWREDEEHLILAPTKEVADASFKPAASMVRADDELADMFHVQDHIRTITHRVTKSSLKIVAADTDTVSGKKAGRILVDELWKFGEKKNAESMFMEAMGGQISRPEGFTIYLTTQSDDAPAGVFKDRLNYWRDVRDGKIKDGKVLPILYEYPPDMVESKAYMEPQNFAIVNPNIGRSVSAEWIADNLRKVQARTDGAFQQFIAKHLNIEIGLNLRADRWPGADSWQECGRKMTLGDLLDRSEVVTIGIDGGGLDDLLGLGVIGRDKETGHWLHWGHAWAHDSVFERRKEIAPRLRDFEAQGDLTAVKQVGDDVRDLADIIKRIYDANLLPKQNAVGIDQIGISFDDIFDDAEIPTELLVGISQGYRLGGTIMNVERKLASGGFEHCNQSLMAWCVGNAKIEQRANSILITKQASGKAKIDPLMALLDAAQLMALNPEAQNKKLIMMALG